jgi:CheY-like chemotaxis protein
MPEKVTLKYDLSENLPAIDVDVTQIRRIIMNLITNASEAIVGEGVITLKSGVVECSHLYLSEAYGHENLSGGTYVYLEVSDTGCGINKEIKDKIFEPFFTTKFFGRGLGLSEVSGIMRAHHGAIMVYNEPGHNTTFRLIFPLAGKTLTEHSKLVTGDIVLVVDDEMSARKMAKTSLERAGFHVITASDGFKAIELLKAYSDMVKVVLLDMDMPQMNGEETFHRLKDISNDVRVIIAMECNDQRIYRQFIDDGVYGFIQKPCRVKDLVEVIYKAVDDYSENMNLNQ